jgi:tRNA(His) guanylyltransferase
MGDSLGDRMKSYEAVTRMVLTRRMPAILRVDGKAFHTLTSSVRKPYDPFFAACMWQTAQALCEEVQGAEVAFVQSDEISVLMVDYKTHDTSAWFDGGVQKIVSVGAAVATAAFGEAFRDAFPGMKNHQPLFDARVFAIPREEVVNYFIWRQQDATRNSIQGLGHARFSNKEMHGLTNDQVQEKLFQERGINWNDEPTWYKRGAAVKRVLRTLEGGAIRSSWNVDDQAPVFTQDRDYIGKHIDIDREGDS